MAARTAYQSLRVAAVLGVDLVLRPPRSAHPLRPHPRETQNLQSRFCNTARNPADLRWHIVCIDVARLRGAPVGSAETREVVMRSLVGFLCVCALGVVPLVGCDDNNGDGGTGGTGGMGGTGGTGGMPECQGPEDCDDGDGCTVDSCTEGMCSYTPADDFTACADSGAGICIAFAPALSGAWSWLASKNPTAAPSR